MKIFSKLANARHNPLHKSVNFYPEAEATLTVAYLSVRLFCSVKPIIKSHGSSPVKAECLQPGNLT